MVVLLVMIQAFYCTNNREYTNIPSCRGKLVFDTSRLQEGIFVYTLVKLYNKANITNMYVCNCLSHFEFILLHQSREPLKNGCGITINNNKYLFVKENFPLFVNLQKIVSALTHTM